MLGLFYRYLNAGNKKFYTKIRGSSVSVLEGKKLLCFWFHNTATQNYFIMMIIKVIKVDLYCEATIIKKDMNSVRLRTLTLKTDFIADWHPKALISFSHSFRQNSWRPPSGQTHLSQSSPFNIITTADIAQFCFYLHVTWRFGLEKIFWLHSLKVLIYYIKPVKAQIKW